MQSTANRLVPLEAYRGIAAFIVLIHHFFLAFSPETTGFLPSTRNADSIGGEPYFVFFNGVGAVGFFFTLSGFVLCWSYFNHEDQSKLLLAFLKRFPRLVGIVSVTTVSSWALFKLDLYYFDAAAKISLSPWLASFGYSGWSPELQPSFVKACSQSFTTFFTGSNFFNSSLWTMKPEFFGSMVVYMLAAFIATVLGYRYRVYALIILSLSALFYSEYIFPFVAGAFLSSYLAKKKVAIPTFASLLMIGVGLYLLGYIIPEKFYGWVSFLPAKSAPFHAVGLHTLGAITIIFATMANRNVFDRLSGSFFRLLGQLSFALYLVHALVIFSLSSWAYLQMTARGFDSTTRLLVVFGVTVVGSLLASLPLSRFDDWWVARVNAVARNVVFEDAERITDAEIGNIHVDRSGVTALDSAGRSENRYLSD